MFKRFRRVWELSKKDPEILDLYEKLTPEEIADIPDASKGDGKAVFLGEGSTEDFIAQERADKGLAGWYERLKNL
jgi:hypothetical protein